MEQPADETRNLRRCVRELAALSVLAAAWGRTGPQGIADGLAEVLMRSLPHVDFVYARVNDLADAAFHEAVRTTEPTSRSQEIGRALEALLKGGNSEPSPVIPNPIGGGTVRLAVVPIGYVGDCGVLVAGSGQADFPGPTDRLLLGVAANQAAVVLQHQRSEEALRRQSALLRAERELLRESEQRFARFMQHLPGLAWIKDLQGRYLYANDAAEKAFRTPRAALYGKTDEEVFPPETARQFRENDRRACAGGAGVQVIETLEHEGGTLRHSVVSKFPIAGPDGGPSLVGGMAIDITDRLRAEEALKEADRRKDEFLATLAHELRNPLAPIRNSLQILKMPRLDAATAERSRQMMERQVHHLVRLVDDLLDVSRVMRGKIDLRRERVELATVVARAVETAQPMIQAQGHELTIHLPEESLALEADPVRLAQVVGNLLTNAAKYTERGGRIFLTAQRVGDRAVLRVRDTGIGIAPDMLPTIFDLFVQVDYAATRSQGGLGIGLTLVKNLVGMHGGTVEAHSQGLGKGSEFVVRLPLTTPKQEEPSEGNNGEHRQQAPPPSGHRLLVVDDNRDAADSLALLLRLQGHEVRVAHDGPAALELAEAYRPEMVFLDIGMPGMDGYEVARRLRRLPGLEGVKLAALTGWGQQEDRRRSKEAGFDHHFVKPVDPTALESLLADQDPSRG